MPRALDPFWEHDTPTHPPSRHYLNCNLCGKLITGGISRLKYHLALISGREVEGCPNTTPKLIHKATKALDDYQEVKQYKEAMRQELASKTKSKTASTTHTLGATGVGHSGTNSCSTKSQSQFLGPLS